MAFGVTDMGIALVKIQQTVWSRRKAPVHLGVLKEILGSGDSGCGLSYQKTDSVVELFQSCGPLSRVYLC